MSNEKISLSFTDGSSDKVYQAELKEVDGGFNVEEVPGRLQPPAIRRRRRREDLLHPRGPVARPQHTRAD